MAPASAVLAGNSNTIFSARRRFLRLSSSPSSPFLSSPFSPSLSSLSSPAMAPASAVLADNGGRSNTGSKFVLITGVSKGLGRALAIELAQRGHTIAGCARSAEKLLELEDLLRDPPEDGVDGGSPSSSKHLFKQVDVASDQSVEAFVKLVVQTKGVPDIIVNNAAIINRSARMWHISAAEFDAVIDINIKGTANVIRHFLPLMKQGIIVNLSSGWGRVGDPDFVPYCTSKFGIEGLTQAICKDVPEGVAIIAVHPGIVHTDMLDICFGNKAPLYPTPERWAPVAADFILGLTPADNGGSLSIS